MDNILALDASTKRTGWATMVDGKIEYGAISASSSYVENRLLVMELEISKLIKKYNITKIVMEEVPLMGEGKSSRTGKVLNWLQGRIAVAAYQIDKKITKDYLEPSTWRADIGIQSYGTKRDLQKQIDIAYVNDHYDFNLQPSQDDEADAICILEAFMKYGATTKKERQSKSLISEESAF